MGFLSPDNRNKLDRDLGTRGTYLKPPSPPGRGLFLTGSLAALSFILIGVAGWFALSHENRSEGDDVATAPPQPVEDKIVTSTPDEIPGTALASDTTPVVEPPREERQDIARLSTPHTDGPLEVLTLEEVAQLTGLTSNRAPTSAPDPITQPEETVVAVAPEVPPSTVPLVEQVTPTPTPVPTQVVAEEAPAPTSLEPVEEVLQAAAPEVAEPLPASCMDEIRDLAATSTIYFSTGSAQLDANGLNLLRTIGSAVAACPQVVVQITGHSDSTGDDATNLSLSWQRADNAISALSALGIDTSRFEPVGFGARAPYSQGDNSNPELDRRVEFTVMQSN